ncbi:uncharacterized protein LOC106180271 [Lingula anatina]|uniref:Uncharacterized protein LOC106180271 n=1 Tax=Lingula anatina TaxID=7574 RepID=A0A1S3KBP9_LINAN|nr:uncharacterized protein LOC106180271 [Lingula anatina]|eukprot:XP_013419681.1 uncharacterized protein LOC106180271 [Lingula anatina]
MEQVKTDIRRSVQSIIQAINEQETQLLRELDEVYNTTVTSRDHLRVVRAIEKLQLAHDYATNMLAKETSPLMLLQNKKDAKNGLEMALKFEAPDIRQHISKLEHRTHFIPGRFNINLGHLMFCTVQEDQAVQDLTFQTHPTPTATYSSTLCDTHGEPFTIAPTGETNKPFAKVGHVAILPNGQVAILTSLDIYR